MEAVEESGRRKAELVIAMQEIGLLEGQVGGAHAHGHAHANGYANAMHGAICFFVWLSPSLPDNASFTPGGSNAPPVPEPHTGLFVFCLVESVLT